MTPTGWKASRKQSASGPSRALRLVGAGLLMMLVTAPSEGQAGEAEPTSDNALATLCGIVEASARAESLPLNFFIRLIWRESAF